MSCVQKRRRISRGTEWYCSASALPGPQHHIPLQTEGLVGSFLVLASEKDRKLVPTLLINCLLGRLHMYVFRTRRRQAHTREKNHFSMFNAHFGFSRA